jgi:hypothetical protein
MYALKLDGYPEGFIDYAINFKRSRRVNREGKGTPVGSMHIPYMKGVSEQFKCIGNRYNIRTIFKTKHFLRSWLMKTRLGRDSQQRALCL